MACIIENTNSSPMEMCGIAGRIVAQCTTVPSVSDISKDFCYCNYICEYQECVFGGATDDCYNDKSSFLYRKLTASDTVVITIEKDGVVVHTVTDQSYGVYIDTFTLQPLYVGFIADWDRILTGFGAGNYKIVTTSTIAGTANVFTSCKFYLQPYTVEAANGTIRVEWWQNGNIEASQFNLTNLEWYQSVRLKSSFVPTEPTVVHDRYLTSDRRSTQIQTQVIGNYELRTKLLPQVKVETLICDMILANEILITNSNIFEKDYKQLKVKPEEVVALNTYAENNRCSLVFSFSDRFENKIKRNETDTNISNYTTPVSTAPFVSNLPIAIWSSQNTVGNTTVLGTTLQDFQAVGLVALDKVKITVKIGAVVQEILRGNILDDISTFSSTQTDSTLALPTFSSGIVLDSGSLNLGIAQWAFTNGVSPTIPTTYVELIIEATDASLSQNSTIMASSTVIVALSSFVAPPIARISQTFVGGTSGIFDLGLTLKETDDSTALTTGDPVVLNYYEDSTKAVLVETLTGTYGDAITAFVSSNFAGAQSMNLHATGSVVDGGTISFGKRDYATANSYLSDNLVDNSSEGYFEISATDTSVAQSNVNSDNNVSLGNGYYNSDSHYAYYGSSPTQYGGMQITMPTNGTANQISDEFYIQGTAVGSPDSTTNNVVLTANGGTITHSSHTAGNYLIAGSHTLRGMRSVQQYQRNDNSGSVTFLRHDLNGAALSIADDGQFTFNIDYFSIGSFSSSLANDLSEVYKGGSSNIAFTDATDFAVTVSGGTLIHTSSSAAQVLTEVVVSANDFGLFHHRKQITMANGLLLHSILPFIITRY